ncbi:MAG: NUDIX hydrolase [Rhodospirillales bacterium]|nr:NUDIX hydrolase [Rhodospirillales bacterium]
MPRPQVAARAVVVHENRLLLVKESSGFWITPGGRTDYGEDIRSCARRETFEETGLSVDIGDVFAISEFFNPSIDFHIMQTLFYARVEEGAALPEQWTDHDPEGAVQASRFFTLEELQNLDNVYPSLLKDGDWLTGKPCDPLYCGIETKE